MTRSARANPAAVALLAATLAACDGTAAPTGTPDPAATSPGVVSTPAATFAPTPEPTPAATPIVLEDVGKEVDLRDGLYVSRLFEPRIQFEVGPGWYRRDEGTDRAFNLRRGNDLAARLLFRRGIDFLQCGSADAIENPGLQAAASAILGMPELDTEPVFETPVGERTGVVIRLRGGGTPMTQDETFTHAYDFGCVFTYGPEVYPAGNWGFVARDLVAQLVLIDVDGVLVFALADGAANPEAFFDLVLEFLETTSLG